MSKKPSDNLDEQRALGLFVKLSRALETVTVLTHRHLAADDLTISQFGILEALYHKGPLCQRDLGYKILKSGGNVTTVINNLERRALVARVPDSDDRRYRSVQLSAAGEALIARVFPRHAGLIRAEMQILSASEQEELGRLCRKLGRQHEGK